MEGRKRLFCYILFAAQLSVSSTQVLRIGKSNSLRTVLMVLLNWLNSRSEYSGLYLCELFNFLFRIGRHRLSVRAVLQPKFKPLCMTKVTLIMMTIKPHRGPAQRERLQVYAQLKNMLCQLYTRILGDKFSVLHFRYYVDGRMRKVVYIEMNQR